MFQLLQNKLGYIRTDIYLGAEIRQDLKKMTFCCQAWHQGRGPLTKGLSREPLVKDKDQYAYLLTQTNSDQLHFNLIFFLFNKKSYLNMEVNFT